MYPLSESNKPSVICRTPVTDNRVAVLERSIPPVPESCDVAIPAEYVLVAPE